MRRGEGAGVDGDVVIDLPTTPTRPHGARVPDVRPWLPTRQVPTLITAACDGDPAAVATLMRCVRPWLARALADCAEHPAHGTAEDAAQDTCERILRSLPRYDAGVRTDAFARWLKIIAFRARVDHHRACGGDRHVPVAAIPDRADTVDPRDGPDDRAVIHEEHARVHAAVGLLWPTIRLCWACGSVRACPQPRSPSSSGSPRPLSDSGSIVRCAGCGC